MKKVIEIVKKIIKVIKLIMKMKNYINVKELIRTYKEETGRNPFNGKDISDAEKERLKMENKKHLRRHMYGGNNKEERNQKQ